MDFPHCSDKRAPGAGVTVTSVGLCEEHSGQGQLVVGYWLGGEGHFAKRNLPLGIDHVMTNFLLMKSS